MMSSMGKIEDIEEEEKKPDNVFDNYQRGSRANM